MKRDLYAEVSARIVAELERGAAPWVKPWSATAGMNTPCNAVTNRPYSGCNVVLLWIARAAGYRAPRFVTYICDPARSTYQMETLWCGGLRDRTFGIINSFLYALLNDRAFLMNSKVSPVSFEPMVPYIFHPISVSSALGRTLRFTQPDRVAVYQRT